MKRPIYLDYNATTPVDPRVLEAMLPYFSEKFGNAASSTHGFGWIAEDSVKRAREQIAAAIGCTEQEIVFTSGSTEGINLAIKGVAEAYASKGDHIITLQTEHKAVLDVCKKLESRGKRISYLPVDSNGLPDLNELQEAINEKTILICAMLANNETGLILPLKEIADIAHAQGIIFMSDTTQAVGKIPVRVDDLGLDLMVMSAHKMYGPKGVGALYVRRRDPRVRLIQQIDGGGHERGRRSGTLNVPGIVGLGMAVEIASAEMQAESRRLRKLRDQLENGLLNIDASRVNGDPSTRMAHVSNMTFEHTDSEALIMAMRHIAVSTGSACTSASMEPSHVLKAMGLEDESAYASIRFSLGRFTTEAEIHFAIRHVTEAIAKLRAMSPDYKARP